MAAVSVSIIMPKLGESVTEGIVERWMKREGDAVRIDESIVEISTDKVTTEVPSPVDGVLASILVQPGTPVPVETVIAIISTTPSASSHPDGQVPVETPTIVEVTHSTQGYGDVLLEASGPDETEARTELSREDLAHLRSTPLVRKLAHEASVPLSDIIGTGFGGRVRRQDLEEHLARRPIDPQPESGPPVVTPFSPVRRIIAARVLASRHSIPDATTFFEVDVTSIARRRTRERDQFMERHGVNLTYLPFVVVAIARSLAGVPGANVRVSTDGLLALSSVDIGITVAIDGQGNVGADSLLTPVIRNAATFSVAQVAVRLAELATQARQGKLSPDELQGAAYTVNNTGGMGAMLSLPIIPDGQTAIMTTDAVIKRPVVLTDADGNDSIAIRSIMVVGLSFDHRAYDGSTAGRLLRAVKTWLEGEASTCPLE